MTLRRGESASTNGCSTSRLAPMPFMSSSGGTDGSVPGRTETRRVRLPTVTVRTYAPRPAGGRAGLLVEDIGAGGLGQLLQVATEGRRRRPPPPGPLAQPRHEVRPPRTLDRLGGAEPLLRVGRCVRGHLERGLGVSRRVDQ